MSWDNMLTSDANLDQVIRDHQPHLSALETRSRARNGSVFLSVMWNRGYAQARRDVLGWVLNLQTRVDDLTPAETVTELRKGPASVYWPVWAADPAVWVECPSGLVHNAGHRTLVTVEGFCRDCGYEFMAVA